MNGTGPAVQVKEIRTSHASQHSASKHPGYLHTTQPLPSEERVEAWGPSYPYTAQSAPPTGSPAVWSTLSMPPSSPTPSHASRVSSSSTLCDAPTLTCTSKKSSPPSPLRPALKRRGTSQDPEGPIKPRYRVSFRNPTVGIPVLMHPLFARSSSTHASPPPSPPLSAPTSPWLPSSRTPSPTPSPRGSPLLRSRSSSPLAPHAFARAIPQPGSSRPHRV
ncbi:hypothetical protein BKA70DRAFT_271515 [Coprinopsis sp. MPI-PUGE-AT-0042]|nr:hypothetical protein BKA70DRAFT_271515 [Coprinopsis sp. MPI-PUGE-AT-0042]